MPEVVGVETLKKIILLGAEGVNLGHKVLNGGPLLGLLGILDEVLALRDFSKDQVTKELNDLLPEERAELLKLFKDKLVLGDQKIELKIEDGGQILLEAVEIAFMVTNLVFGLVERIKKLLS